LPADAGIRCYEPSFSFAAHCSSTLLAPQGTRISGQYDNNVQFGQSCVLLVWNRLIFSNGRSIILERQPGADAEDDAGLQDGVDYLLPESPLTISRSAWL
jgi:type IV secretory pathway VirB10-like protein